MKCEWDDGTKEGCSDPATTCVATLQIGDDQRPQASSHDHYCKAHMECYTVEYHRRTIIIITPIDEDF